MGKKKPKRSGIELHYDALMDSAYFGTSEESDREVRALLAGHEVVDPAEGSLLHALAILARQEQILLEAADGGKAADGGPLSSFDNSLWHDLLDMCWQERTRYDRIHDWIMLAAEVTEDSTWGIILPASCRLAARVLIGRAGGRFAEPGGS